MKPLFRSLVLLIALAIAISAGDTRSGSVSCPSSGRTKITSTSARAVTWTLQAPTANTGAVYVGGSTVTTTQGVFMKSGDAYQGPPQGNSTAYDLSNIYIACTVNTDTVTFTYWQ